MNPLTRALKLAENPPAAARTTDQPANQSADQSDDRMAGEFGALDPVRTTRHDPAAPSQTLPPAGTAFSHSPDPEIPEAARLAPLRTTQGDSDPESPPPTAPAIGVARSPERPNAAPLAPLRATGDHTAVDAALHGIGGAVSESPGPIPAALGGAPSGSAGVAAGDMAVARAVERDGFRSLPGSRSLGRGIGIAVSMLVAAGAAAGGGAFLWRTELARPALVRDLPPLQEAGPGPAWTHSGDIAGDGAHEPAGAAAPARRDTPAVFAATPDDGIPPDRPVETTESGNPTDLSAMTENGEGAPILAATRRGEGHPAPLAVAGKSGTLPTRSEAAPGRKNPHALPTAGPGGSRYAAPSAVPGELRYPAPSTRSPGGKALPADSTAAPTPGLSPIALPAPEATGETHGRAPGAVAPQAAGLPAGNDTPEEEWGEVVATTPGSGARIVITRRTRADHVAESLGHAYEAYLAGDREAAGQAYRFVLRHEPRNRDARLGLAAVAAQAGRRDEAAEHYLALLASHPADTAARAALIAIAEEDPTRVESGLRALLRIEPEAAHLHFSLGNLYAAESRWPEAQRAWFRAYRLERGNADHAYNLAVGLDHLSQPRNAVELYREALVLAQGAHASFETEAVRTRIRILESRMHAEREPGGSHEAPSAATTVDSR